MVTSVLSLLFRHTAIRVPSVQYKAVLTWLICIKGDGKAQKHVTGIWPLSGKGVVLHVTW